MMMMMILEKNTVFLGHFAALQNATIRLVMSVCLSVLPYGAARFPLDGFSLNLTPAFFGYLPTEFNLHQNRTRIFAYFI